MYDLNKINPMYQFLLRVRIDLQITALYSPGHNYPTTLPYFSSFRCFLCKASERCTQTHSWSSCQKAEYSAVIHRMQSLTTPRYFFLKGSKLTEFPSRTIRLCGEAHTSRVSVFSDKALMVLPLSSRLLKTFWKLKTDQVHRVTCIRAPPSGATENDASRDWTPSHDEEQQRYMTAYSTLFTRHTLRSWVSIFRSLLIFLQIYLAVP